MTLFSSCYLKMYNCQIIRLECFNNIFIKIQGKLKS